MRIEKILALCAILTFGLSACAQTEMAVTGTPGNERVLITHEEPLFFIGVIPTFLDREAAFNFTCTPTCVQVKKDEEKEK